MSDCRVYEEVLSAAFDGEIIAADALTEANAHCESCAECQSFRASLSALAEHQAPEPPSDLLERVVARIQAERDSDRGLALVDSASNEIHGAQPSPGGASRTPQTLSDLLHVAWSPKRRRETAIWFAAAATAAVFAGYGAVAGMRMIVTPSLPVTAADSMAQSAPAGARAVTAPQTYGGAEIKASPYDNSASLSRADVPAQLVSAAGTAYSLVGSSDAGTITAGLSEGPPITSSLETSVVAVHRSWLSQDEATLWVEQGSGVLQFARVTRGFNGRVYALHATGLTHFGVWPSWPADRVKPADGGGSGYAEAGTDGYGTTVYTPAGGAAVGIAVPPTQAPGDPVAGAGVWTWWHIVGRR